MQIDFPRPDGSRERLTFDAPIETIVVESPSDVRDALDRVEAHAAAGRYAAGFVSYDAAPGLDAALPRGERAPTPLVWFGIYEGPRHEREDTTAAVELQGEHWSPHVDRATYEARVEEIKQGIRAGDFYQVNHTIRLRSPMTAEPYARFMELRAAQPASYAMYVDTGRFQILSVSPELFFSRTGREIETRPMKGTAPRGRWPAEDADVGRSLAASEKERAENVMIVDLVRNDLGRIAEFGSVAVPRLFDVERHPTVWQMTSNVRARLRQSVSLADIFAALFPCGSVVGAPKIAAARWIAEHEGAPRGVYCGAMGLVRPGGDCVFNVAIRTMVVDRDTGTAEYGTGGGITIDSTASGEYDELRAKANVLARAMPDFELLETMRLSDGLFPRRGRHLSRLLASAAYFGFSDPSQAVERALDDQAAHTPRGDHRVRLLVARDGRARTESSPTEKRGDEPRALRCAISPRPVDSRDVFLFHKTTNRRVYDERRAAAPDVDEIILVNERGEVTECAIGNLVLESGGEHVTPPLSCGLLPGVFREELLEQGAITERVLRPADLRAATRCWRINSLREWVPLEVELALRETLPADGGASARLRGTLPYGVNQRAVSE